MIACDELADKMTRDEDVVVTTRLAARMRAVAAVPGMAATVAAKTTGATVVR